MLRQTRIKHNDNDITKRLMRWQQTAALCGSNDPSSNGQRGLALYRRNTFIWSPLKPLTWETLDRHKEIARDISN